MSEKRTLFAAASLIAFIISASLVDGGTEWPVYVCGALLLIAVWPALRGYQMEVVKGASGILFTTRTGKQITVVGTVYKKVRIWRIHLWR